MSDPTQFPHTQKQSREEEKRKGFGGKKAGKVAQKGGAPTSNKAFGGKGAR